MAGQKCVYYYYYYCYYWWNSGEWRSFGGAVFTVIPQAAILSNTNSNKKIFILDCSLRHNIMEGNFCSALVQVRTIVINASVCLSVHEHVSRTAGPIFTKYCVHIPRGRCSVLLRRRCATLCTSGFMNDVTFGRNVNCERSWLWFYGWRHVWP